MSRSLFYRIAFCICTLFIGTIVSAQEAADRTALLAGVRVIAAPGLPGAVSVFSDTAFSVVEGSAGRGLTGSVVAAGHLGRGRVVAFGHTSYFETEALAASDTGKLVLNSVHWARSPASSSDLPVGVRHLPALLAFLKMNRVNAEPLDGPDWSNRAAGYSVVCCFPADLTDGEIDRLSRTVKAGVGLVAAETGWGWQQIHGGESLKQYGGNRLLAPAGLCWTDGTLERTDANGFRAEPTVSELIRADLALKAIEEMSDGKATRSPAEIRQANQTILLTARSLPDGDRTLLPRLQELERKHQSELNSIGLQPIPGDKPLQRLLVTMYLDRIRTLPPEQITASPAAAAFPGAVPADAPRVTRTLTIDTSVPEWHSTGLYAAPGEKIEITLPSSAVDKRFQVRIGAHTDTLWNLDRWDRMPEITRVFPLKAVRTTAANPFGGLIYIVVPRSRNGNIGSLSVTIHNAVEAPYYVVGKTDLAQWRSAIRNAPAPWAELETNSVILTVPSRVVRTLEDPESLLKLWDSAMDNIADLAVIPRNRPFPQRYVTDKQISAGYMHSGYPIMTFLDVAPAMVNKETILTNGHPGVWGFFHEMGHNHQQAAWTFEGTGEVTNNLFALYVFEKVCHIDEAQHPAIRPDAMRKRLAAYIAGGASYAQWKNDPFLALTMYIELRQAFGWEPFKKVFSEYQHLTPGEAPRTDQQKRDQWMTRFSRACGKDLGPFFQAWGVPTTEQARKSISDLSAWMPADFPSK